MQASHLLKEKIRENKIDGLLVTNLINIRYLSKFTGSSAFMILTEGNGVFVTDFRYEEQAKKEVKDYEIRIEKGERTGEIIKICHDLKIKKLGFESEDVTYGFYVKLRRKIRVKPIRDLIESLRAVKSDEEIRAIKRAIKRAERAFRKLIPHIREGVTERAIAMRLETFLKEEGCKKLPFEVIVASGHMAALPHATPGNRRIKRGDLVVIDWGGEYNGYFSDMTRTLIVGRGDDLAEKRKIYNCVLEAQERAIKSVRAGMLSTHVDKEARDYIKRSGYGEYFGHGTGHGVGLEVHEAPVISWRKREILKKNMVFTIEPGIYIPGLGGVRIEDMILVKNNRAEVLTSLPKKLKIIGV
jgi:Xaa-Pro aminopeptidase